MERDLIVSRRLVKRELPAFVALDERGPVLVEHLTAPARSGRHRKSPVDSNSPWRFRRRSHGPSRPGCGSGRAPRGRPDCRSCAAARPTDRPRRRVTAYALDGDIRFVEAVVGRRPSGRRTPRPADLAGEPVPQEGQERTGIGRGRQRTADPVGRHHRDVQRIIHAGHRRQKLQIGPRALEMPARAISLSEADTPPGSDPAVVRLDQPLEHLTRAAQGRLGGVHVADVETVFGVEVAIALRQPPAAARNGADPRQVRSPREGGASSMPMLMRRRAPCTSTSAS